MQFDYTPRPIRRTPADEAVQKFKVDRLWARQDDNLRDVSHLVDRSYGYHSARELQWHLAERFGLPVRSVRLSLH